MKEGRHAEEWKKFLYQERVFISGSDKFRYAKGSTCGTITTIIDQIYKSIPASTMRLFLILLEGLR